MGGGVTDIGVKGIQKGYLDVNGMNMRIENRGLSLIHHLGRFKIYFDGCVERGYGYANSHNDLGEEIPKIFWKYYDLYRRNKITLDDYTRETNLSASVLQEYLLMVN